MAIQYHDYIKIFSSNFFLEAKNDKIKSLHDYEQIG